MRSQAHQVERREGARGVKEGIQHSATTPVDGVHRCHGHNGPDFREDADCWGAEEPEVSFGDDGGSWEGLTEFRNHSLSDWAVPETMGTHGHGLEWFRDLWRGAPATSTGEGDVMATHGADAIDSEAPKRVLVAIVPRDPPKVSHCGL